MESGEYVTGRRRVQLGLDVLPNAHVNRPGLQPQKALTPVQLFWAAPSIAGVRTGHDLTKHNETELLSSEIHPFFVVTGPLSQRCVQSFGCAHSGGDLMNRDR